MHSVHLNGFFILQLYRHMYIRLILISSFVAILLPGLGAAQEWTEERVVAEALERNPRLREARLATRAAEAGADVASSFMWPSLNVGAGWTRSDDPVFAFGAKLRQGLFTEGDFSLAELNQPGAIDDWSTGVTAAWGILSPERWASSTAGRREADAVRWTAARAAQDVRLSARVLFQQAVAAEARADAARLDVQAKAESRRVILQRVEQGLLTEVDALQAEAEWQGARAALQLADQAREDAKGRLAILVARQPSEIGPLVPSPEPLESMEATGETFVAGRVGLLGEGRADLRAFAAQVSAAESRVSAAQGSRLPSLTAHASWNTYAGSFSNDPQSRWTGGISLAIPVFTGFSSRGRIAAAQAQVEAARLREDDARRRAESEVAEARRAVASSREVVASADAAAAAASEALRLMRRRFEEGLATTLDLLNAQARAAALRSMAVEYRSGHYIALARLEWAALDTSNERETP
jgi:outer membrane protein TolC